MLAEDPNELWCRVRSKVPPVPSRALTGGIRRRVCAAKPAGEGTGDTCQRDPNSAGTAYRTVPRFNPRRTNAPPDPLAFPPPVYWRGGGFDRGVYDRAAALPGPERADAAEREDPPGGDRSWRPGGQRSERIPEDQPGRGCRARCAMWTWSGRRPRTSSFPTPSRSKTTGGCSTRSRRTWTPCWWRRRTISMPSRRWRRWSAASTFTAKSRWPTRCTRSGG